jgi:FkbM family methyltransferase
MSQSLGIRVIRRLPGARRLALRVWNRLLMHFAPHHKARTYFGAVINCDVRDMIQATIIHFGIWEPEISRAFELLVKSRDTVADVGANIGYYSLLCAKLVGKHGQVVSIEAHPRLAQAASVNAKANRMSNIRVVQAAASDSDGVLQLFEAPRTNVGMTSTRPESGFAFLCDVPAKPFHAMLTPDEARNLALIKIDIEGAEIAVLRDILLNYDMFPRSPAIIVEANTAHNPEWPTVFHDAIRSGFVAFDLHNDYGWDRLMAGDVAQPTRLKKPPARQTDILLIPEERASAFENAAN